MIHVYKEFQLHTSYNVHWFRSQAVILCWCVFKLLQCMHALLNKSEVKMAWYWPKFFVHFCDEDEVQKRTEQGQYPAILTEQAWSMDLFYGQKITPNNFTFAAREQSGQSWAAKIGPSYPLRTQDLLHLASLIINVHKCSFNRWCHISLMKEMHYFMTVRWALSLINFNLLSPFLELIYYYNNYWNKHTFF